MMKTPYRPFVDVALQRHRMTVVEVTAERAGLEFVDERLAGQDLAGAGHAVDARRMDAMKVHGVRHGAGVGERDADQVALGHAQRRAGHAPVVGPGREEHARRDLDLAIERGDPELPQAATVRQQSRPRPCRNRSECRRDRSRCAHGPRRRSWSSDAGSAARSDRRGRDRPAAARRRRRAPATRRSARGSARPPRPDGRAGDPRPPPPA